MPWLHVKVYECMWMRKDAYRKNVDDTYDMYWLKWIQGRRKKNILFCQLGWKEMPSRFGVSGVQAVM